MRKRKASVVVALAAVVTFMGVAYALLSQNITVNGNAKITSDWKVEITNVEVVPDKGGQNMNSAFTEESEDVDYDGTSVTFYSALPKPGAGVSYMITIENTGNIAATIDNDSLQSQFTDINSQEPADVTFGVMRMESGMSTNSDPNKLNPGEKVVYTVNATWNESATVVPTTLTKSATLNFNFVQESQEKPGV